MRIDLPPDLPDTSLVRSIKDLWQAELLAAERAVSAGDDAELQQAMTCARGWRDLLFRLADDYRAGRIRSI